MLITNKMNLPDSFVQMAQSDYVLQPHEYRATSLLKGIRETLLERRHTNDISMDVSDMIWMLFGTAVHSVLERSTVADHMMKETRLKAVVDGIEVSGQFDLFNTQTGILTDYKTASVWKVINGDYADWRKQLLIYAWLLTQSGHKVVGGEIIAMLKDHKKSDAKHKQGYPLLPIYRVEFTFTANDIADTGTWLRKQAEAIRLMADLEDDYLPICTPQERWNKGGTYAVMKKGRKTALRVLDTNTAAEDWMLENGGDSIEVRQGADMKCLEYCQAREFCSHWKEITKA